MAEKAEYNYGDGYAKGDTSQGRLQLQYVSTKLNSYVSEGLSVLGNALQNVGSKTMEMANQQNKADEQFVANTALKMYENKKDSFIQDGNYHEFDNRYNKFMVELRDNLVTETGNEKAVDSWLKNYKKQFQTYTKLEFEKSKETAFESLNKTSVDRDSNLYASTPGGTYNGLLETGQKAYAPDSDLSGKNNPSTPENRTTYGLAMWQTNASNALETMFASGEYKSEDEMVESIVNGGSWNEFTAYVMGGFETEGYEANPSNPSKELYSQYLDSIKPNAEKYVREAYRNAETEHKTQIENTAKNFDNQVAYNSAMGKVYSTDEILKGYSDLGLNTSDPYVQEHIANEHKSVRDEWENAQDATSLKNYRIVQAESQNITDMIGARQGKTEEGKSMFSVYSDSGKTEMNEDDVRTKSDTYAFIQSECWKLFGNGEVSVATQYGAEVEEICDKYNITDKREKMQIASYINSLFPAGVAYTVNASNGQIVPTSNGKTPGASRLESMLDNLTNYSDEECRDAIDKALINGEISNQQFSEYNDRVDKRNSPIDRQANDLLAAIKSRLKEWNIDGQSTLLGILGENTTLMDHLRKWCQNNPNATDEQKERYCDAIIGRYSSAKAAKEISATLDGILDDATDLMISGYIDIDNGDKTLQSVWDGYINGENIFINKHPEAMAKLKTAINGGSFTSYSDLKKWTAVTFLGENYKELYDEEKIGKDAHAAIEAMLNEAMTVAFVECEQYNLVKDAAIAARPDATEINRTDNELIENTGGYFKEIRFTDGTIGIMDRQGYVYRTNGRKSDLYIGFCDGEAYRMVWNNPEYSTYSGNNDQSISWSSVKGVTAYTKTFSKGQEQSVYSKDLSYENQSLNTLQNGTAAEFDKAREEKKKNKNGNKTGEANFKAETVFITKPDAEVTWEDFANDKDFRAIFYKDIKNESRSK